MLTVFQFESQNVRFVGTSENPEWVAKDVCNCLGIKNVSDALADLEPQDKGIVSTDTPSGQQEMLTVTESGLYALIFKSRKPEAKRFKRWVFEEVLPSIRKTGSYSTNTQKQLPQRDAIDYVLATKAVNQMEDCILTRLLKDALVDELSIRQNNNLLQSDGKQNYTIVKVRAKELGYTEAQIGCGTALGRFVKSTVKPVFQENVGRYKVWHYEINDDLDNAIHAYFS